MVKVSFNIKGNSYVDKKDGLTKYITNLDAWRVEAAGAAANNSGGQQAPAYNSAGASSNQGGNNYNTTPNFNPSSEPIDDLPF